MFKLTIPFTNEVLFNAEQCIDNQMDEVVVNEFDEVRGTINIKVKSFKVDELTVHMVDLKCPENVLICAQVMQYGWMKTYVLSGQIGLERLDTRITLYEHTDHSLLPQAEQALEIVIRGEAQLFIVCLAGTALKRLLKPEEEEMLMHRANEPHALLSGQVSTPAMVNIINTITDDIHNNRLHRVLLAAKTLELLFLDLEQLQRKGNDAVNTIKAYDLEKLQMAKNLVAENLQSPLSLVELAHKVGLNDFKLKKGFKAAFGTTVFGYLFDLRMKKAVQMLGVAKHSVSEVAHEVGYKNAHHFTVAFKKNFGYLPSKMAGGK